MSDLWISTSEGDLLRADVITRVYTSTRELKIVGTGVAGDA